MTLFSKVPNIQYESPSTSNEFAYRVYDKDKMVLNRRMEEWLRIAVCYWHSFSWPGTDMFGAGTLTRPWQGARVTLEMAEEKLNAAFDFFTRLGTPYFTFHDTDAMASAGYHARWWLIPASGVDVAMGRAATLSASLAAHTARASERSRPSHKEPPARATCSPVRFVPGVTTKDAELTISVPV